MELNLCYFPNEVLYIGVMKLDAVLKFMLCLAMVNLSSW